jgi:tRNA(fMet)-specific endonuclease VapC
VPARKGLPDEDSASSEARANEFVLVDTDAFIHLSRGKARVAELAPYVAGRRVVISFATVAELRRGAHAMGYGADSWRRLEADVSSAIVVAPTTELTDEWARLSDQARKMGHPLGQKAQAHDAWIAATGRLYELPILTDDSHFEDFPDLKLFPPRVAAAPT